MFVIAFINLKPLFPEINMNFTILMNAIVKFYERIYYQNAILYLGHRRVTQNLLKLGNIKTLNNII